MATEIPVTNQLPNAGTPVTPAGLDAGDHYVLVGVTARTGVTDVKTPELLQLVVTAGEEPVTVTVGGGSYPPALASGLGDVAHEVPAGATALVGPFESGRVESQHLRVGGTDLEPVTVPSAVAVHLSAGADVAAFRFPRNT